MVVDGKVLEEGDLHFGYDKNLKQSRMLIVGTDKENGDLEVMQLSGYISKIEDKNYYSYQNPDEQDDSDFQIIKYEIDGDKFLWRCVDKSKIEKAVHDGVLKGYVKISSGTFGTDTHIQVTDTPENIRKYIVENDKDLFSGCGFISDDFELRRMRVTEIN